ncbi:MAG: polysaccharide deacetylase family protein [Clostridia bacterium]|nr:polysaccharide deacetylase family protein [Clostridia bacterium]
MKIIICKIIKNRLWQKIFCVFLCVAIIAVSIYKNEQIKSMMCGKSLREIPIYSVERNDKRIALSFDCAWGNEYTQTLLDEMNNYGVTCTFFAVSFWAEKYPDDLKNIVSQGHEVGTHSKTHSHMSKLTQVEIDNELSYSKQVIEQITGQRVTLFRAPFGEYNNLLIERAREAGLFTIQWDVDSLDWKDLSAQDIAKRIISKVKPGSIILCHNNGLHTAESLPLIFSALIANGYEFVKISDLIYKDNYDITNEGKQVKTNL